MKDKTRDQLVAENEKLRRRVTELEKALQKNQSATAFLQLAPLGIHECDTEGRITFVNPSQEAITGYTADELVGTYIWGRIEPGPEKDALPAYFKYLVSEQPLPTPFFATNIRKNGEVFDVRIDWNYKRDQQGQVTGFVSIVSDITEQKRAEEALRESEERFRQAMEATNDGLWDWDVKSGECYYSPAYSRILGYEAAEFANRTESWTDLLHPDDRAEAVSVNQDCIENRIPHFEAEFRMRAKSGEWRWILGRGRAVCRDASGRATRMIGTHVDITERRRAEEELAKSKAILQAAIECLPFDFFAIGEDGRYVLQNAVCRAHWGRLVGKTPEEMAPTEDVRALWSDNNRRAFAGEKVEDEVAVTIKGEERFVYNILTPIRDETHSYGILGVNVDITQRKRAEEALKKAHDELEQKVKERTAELSAANEQLRREIEQRRQAEENLAVFRRLAEASSQGFGIADLDGRLIYMNPTLRRFAGQSDDYVGTPVFKSVPEEYSRQLKEEIFPVVLRDGYWEGEWTSHTATGEIAYTLNNIFRIQDADGNPAYIADVVTDISERKQAEEALRQSEARFRSYFEQGLIGMAVSSPDRRWTQVNDHYCDMLGYSRDELLAMNWTDLTHSDDLERNLVPQNRLLTGEIEHYTLDKRFLRKDGSIMYATVFARCFRRQDGSVDHFLSLIEDTTDRKRAQEALAESEMKYRQLVETTGTGYLILDGQGRVIDANAEYLRISGHQTLKEILGQTVVEWTASYDVDRNAKEVEKCYQQGFVRQLEIDYVHPDGKIIPTEINATCLDTENGRRIVSLCRDISERREAQEALRQSHDELRAIYGGVVEGLAITDVETKRFVRVNSALCQMLGYAEEELLVASLKDIHPPEEVANDMARFRAVAEGLVSIHEDRPFLKKDGSIFYADIVARPIAYNGRPCTLALLHDVTERHKSQEALERERQSLWRMLQASDHERQIISYDIHDGLAQYLAAANMQFQVFDHLRDSNPEEAKKAYDAATQLVSQAHSETRRLISEVRPPVIDEIGLETAMSHLVHEQRRRGGTKIHFDSNVQFDRLPPILENAIYRIVQEALTNACKHSQSKEVKVTITQEGREARLEVQDWGIGFDPESVEKGHFGLEGIRQRIRLLGGRLTIESKPGSGTLVQVVVPIVERKGEE